MFILRIPNRKIDYTLTEKLHVSFYRRTRATGETIGGMFRMMEDAGIDEKVLQVVPANQQENKPTSSHGRSPQRYWHVFRRHLTNVREHVRVMPDEALARVQAIDHEIESRRREIGELQNQRHQIVQVAWRSAKPASLAELVAQANERRDNKGRLKGEEVEV